MVTSSPKPHGDLLSIEIDHAHLRNLVIVLTIRALFYADSIDPEMVSELRLVIPTRLSISECLHCVKELMETFVYSKSPPSTRHERSVVLHW